MFSRHPRLGNGQNITLFTDNSDSKNTKKIGYFIYYLQRTLFRSSTKKIGYFIYCLQRTLFRSSTKENWIFTSRYKLWILLRKYSFYFAVDLFFVINIFFAKEKVSFWYCADFCWQTHTPRCVWNSSYFICVCVCACAYHRI